jgi:hypothetical protein
MAVLDYESFGLARDVCFICRHRMSASSSNAFIDAKRNLSGIKIEAEILI